MAEMDVQTVKNQFRIYGNSPKLNRAIEIAVKVAKTEASVLITGESGVGKDVFSKIIHFYSNRNNSRYVAVNCAAIPEGTIESELFGHVKGSFTGADKDRKGYFAEADKGTIFLDEIGELPLSTQAKLLRVLENGEILPVGSSRAVKVDVRVVAATNVDLMKRTERGSFRMDLYYRINQISIEVPSLRERKEDIELLFRAFSAQVADKYNIPRIRLNDDARNLLKFYEWKGNVRELKNLAEKISILEIDRMIDAPTLRKYLPKTESMPMLVDGLSQGENMEELMRAVINNKNEIEKLKEEIAQLKTFVLNFLNMNVSTEKLLLPCAEKNTDLGFVEENGEEETENRNINLKEIEKKSIMEALEKYNGKRNKAAKELGCSERTLYRKIKEFGINKTE